MACDILLLSSGNFFLFLFYCLSYLFLFPFLPAATPPRFPFLDFLECLAAKSLTFGPKAFSQYLLTDHSISWKKTFPQMLLYLPNFRTDGLLIKSGLSAELKEYVNKECKKPCYHWKGYLSPNSAYKHLLGHIKIYSGIYITLLALQTNIFRLLLVVSFKISCSWNKLKNATLNFESALIKKYNICKRKPVWVKWSYICFLPDTHSLRSFSDGGK